MAVNPHGRFYPDKGVTLEEYIEEKIEMLKDFKIILDKEQKRHIKSLKSELAVDNFAHDLIFK